MIMRCLEKKPEQRYQTMHAIEADLQRVHAGQRAVGPDTVTLTPTRPPRPERRPVSPIYLGGLGVAVLALVGTLAVNVYTERRADMNSTRLAVPEATVTTPPVAEEGDLEPSDDQSSPAAPDTPELKAQAARATPVRRKPRHRSKPSPQRDQAILDPWK